MSGEDVFRRLAPFVREYIFRHGWSALRDVQLAAAGVVFDTDHHLLLASGTASGKTEAAFLPILTQMSEDPPASLGTIYIGPTKALINDQFHRLQGLLREVDIPLWHWHGDVGRDEKLRMQRVARGILQITPESLESLLINHPRSLPTLFQDLRYVVIDEVHVFMGSERGQQILCQLSRLQSYCRQEPRRVGLSATLGDYQQAKQWLAAGSRRRAIVANPNTQGQRLRLSLQHFLRASEELRSPQGEGAATLDPYYRYIWEQAQGKKTLIFANNRSETEAVITALRQIAQENHHPDIFHVHHGSISASLRQTAEEAMRDPHQAAITAATLTLELGIDLGELETVINLDAPPAVSSFLQRLGRSGRRGQPAEMRLVTSEEENCQQLPFAFPWQLLQAIAVIELYLQERWIEPIAAPKLPVSLLYHQTMSILLECGSLPPQQLARKVLTLPPFAQVSSADYRRLLLHLLETDHLQRLEDGQLLIGLTAERVVRDWRFYAVFSDSDEYLVRDANHDIGRISNPPSEGDRLALAGRTWEVMAVDAAKRLVLVKAVSGRGAISWPGNSAPVHTRVMQHMRQVLLSNQDYRYLQPEAKRRLTDVRAVARRAQLDRHHLVPLGNNLFLLFPWMGTKAFRTLERCLRFVGRSELGVHSVSGHAPYFLVLHTDDYQAAALQRQLKQMVQAIPSGSALLGREEAPQWMKYDRFIPAELLRRAYIDDQLALPELQRLVRDWD
ncbi:MAG: DEAD/DEAH box helicase [Bacillota bacterium]